MQALVPEGVDMARAADGDHWYTETASAATAVRGGGGVAIALAHVRRCLGLDGA